MYDWTFWAPQARLQIFVLPPVFPMEFARDGRNIFERARMKSAGRAGWDGAKMKIRAAGQISA